MKRILLILLAAVGCNMVLAKNQIIMDNDFKQPFPQGEPLPAQFSRYFIGQAYLAPVSNNETLGTHISNVTFSPACRNNWHSHTGGQLLICTAGRGFYQERGGKARELHAGDVVEIAPNVEHWHGAAPDSWFAHLAVECNVATNKNTWLEPVDDAQYEAATGGAKTVEKADGKSVAGAAWRDETVLTLAGENPEFAEIVERFAFGDVMQSVELDMRTRLLATLVSTVAQNTPGECRVVVESSLQEGIAPLEIREAIYHAAAYAGIARVRESLAAAGEVMRAHGIALPLSDCATVDARTRFEKGLALQKSIFGGDHIDAGYKNAPEGQLHFQKMLSANCFGDYQTRGVFDTPMRELLTYAVLISLGGCEPQVKAHIRGNLNEGNSKKLLIAVTTQLLPYIGYPRTLNAVRCVNEVEE